MELKMFSIRDAKAEIFTPPFFKSTTGEAERDFQTAVNDDKTMLHKYPEDYDLWFIGTYDDQTGTTQSLETPLHIAKAVALKREI